MSVWLIVEKGPNTGDSFHLRQSVLTVGRSPVNLLQVNDKSVSRRHAQLRKQGDDYVITDLKSSNGTFLNGQRLTDPALLKHDDIVQLGEVVLRYKTRTIRGNMKDPMLERKDASKATRFLETEVHEIDDSILNVIRNEESDIGT